MLAISPPLVCAFLARNSDRWDLFERSGSMITAIGLLTASRRDIRYGVLKLAMLVKEHEPDLVGDGRRDFTRAGQGPWL